MFWSRRDRHVSEEDLSAFVDGELAPSRLASVRTHLDGCEVCRQTEAHLRDMKTLISQLPEATVPLSFVLSPQMAGIPAAPPPTRPRAFVFAPAVAFTLLVALLSVDLLASTSSSDDETAGGLAMSQKAEDTALNSAPAGEQRVTSSTSSGAAGTPSAASAAPPVTSGGSADGALALPSVAAPRTGPGTDGTVTATVQAFSPSPVATPTVMRDAAFADDSDSPTASNSDSGTGADWLRIGQIVTAIAFVTSLAYVFGPGLMKRGSS